MVSFVCLVGRVIIVVFPDFGDLY